MLPIFGSLPPISEEMLQLLGLVSLAYFFENYDLSMVMSALSYIAADFGITEAELGSYTGLMRLGALPAFLLLPLADRVGRRRVFLIGVAGVATTTFLTAFAATVVQYVALQMLLRMFVLASTTLAFVIVAEEFPAEHRGWGIGMVGAIGATGFGFGAILFGFVNHLPFGWRTLYLVGIVPLALLPTLRRGVPETRRFTRQREARRERATGSSNAAALLGPIAGLLRAYPTRVLAVTLAGGLYAVGEIGVFQFCGYFVLTNHRWEPWQFSTMVVGAGAIGMLGNVVAGRAADLFGRRPLAAGVALTFPAAAYLFYHASSGWLPALWAWLTVCSVSCGVMIRALGTEVFPTSQRGTAGGWLTLVQTLGTAGGLGLVGFATGLGATLPSVLSGLALLCALGASALFLLPETNRLELEAIADDDAL
jgi:MFS family permease